MILSRCSYQENKKKYAFCVPKKCERLLATTTTNKKRKKNPVKHFVANWGTKNTKTSSSENQLNSEDMFECSVSLTETPLSGVISALTSKPRVKMIR